MDALIVLFAVLTIAVVVLIVDRIDAKKSQIAH